MCVPALKNPQTGTDGMLWTMGMANMLSKGRIGFPPQGFNITRNNQQTQQQYEQPSPFFANRSQIANNQQSSGQDNQSGQTNRFSFRNTA